MKQKPTILAIDDTPVNLRTLGTVLAADYDVRFATSGPQGLVLAAKSPPDLILLDIMMPDMDGFEVCRRLKADPQLCNIPVIFITAMTESEAETAGLQLGAADFLTKPINVAVARLRIQNLIEREALRAQVELHREHLEELVKQRTLSLSIAKEAADSANRLKATILANISHEFRTPMNGVLGMLSMARRRTQDEKAIECLSKAEGAANHLLATLTGLLDLAMAESKRLTLEWVPFRLADIATSAAEHFAVAVVPERLPIEFQATPPSQPDQEWLVGDPQRVGQILHELIANALKFSNQGRIEVTPFLETDSANKQWFGFRVTDQGIGIAPEDQRRIFEPFTQIDGSMTRHFGGNGIGLALCRQLARHMGGDVKVESELGQGAMFSLRVPAEQSLAPA